MIRPTKKSIASRNGILFGSIKWPPGIDDCLKLDAWKLETPDGFLFHEHVVSKTKTVCYALPCLGDNAWKQPGTPIDVAANYERAS